MKQRIPPHEFAAWVAYDSIEPFGEWRADLRMGIQTAAIVNALCGAKSKSADFMPDFAKPEPKRQTAEQMKALLKARFGKQHGHEHS